MQALAAKAAKKAVEKEVKKTLKDNLPTGPKIRGGGEGTAAGCCNKCCGAVCRTDPWRQAICWVLISLIVVTLILFFGGGFLVGPAKGASGSPCGVTLNIPILNKDAYIFFLTSSGILVFVMIFISCICCCSMLAVCCGDFPRVIKIVGIIGLIITALGLLVYSGWVAMGTYFVIKVHSADTICRNTIIYVVVLYVYLAVILLVGVVIMCWKCHQLRVNWQSSRRSRSKTKYQKLPQQDPDTQE